MVKSTLGLGYLTAFEGVFDMQLLVENFGPIRKAKVELGPMTVFVGHSNTGKSYLAGLVYAVMRALSADHSEDLWKQISQPTRSQAPAVRELLAHAHTIANSAKKKKEEKVQSPISSEMQKTLLILWAKAVNVAWKDAIAHCFGRAGQDMLKVNNLVVKIVSDDNLLILDLCNPANSTRRRGRATARQKQATQKKTTKQQSRKMDLDLSLATMKHSLSMAEEQSDLTEQPNHLWLAFALLVLLGFSFWSEFMGHSPQVLEKVKGGNLKFRYHYLPASRGGIMQSHHALVESVVVGAAVIGLNDAPSKPAFSGIVSDFLRKLVALPALQKQRKHGASKKAIENIRRDMEANIISGKIEMETSETKYPSFLYKFRRDGKAHSLPLMSTSSMVSELASFSIFLRYYVKPGDLLIFEEPESHLHPEAQRDITKALVQLVNLGVHVLITTHSDVILEQLGNYVHAAENGVKIHKQSLVKDNIQAYWFRMPKKGAQKNTVVKDAEYDRDTGFLTKDHLDVSSLLYNESVRLFNEGERAREKTRAKSKKNAD